MSLVTEDGTGVANAESYCSVLQADAHHAAFGNTTWAGASTAEKEVALRRATRWMDARWGGLWKGVQNTQAQALDWPRGWVIDEDGYGLPSGEIPPRLVQACAEAALRALSEDLLLDVTDSGTVVEESVSVGSLSTTTRWEGGKGTQKAYPIVDALVRTLLVTDGGTVIRC